MNINKTADECIVESASVLLKCFVDPNLSLTQKQKFTKWITWFFDYQDAINNSNQKQIDFLQQKLSLTFVPSYYKNALQEFKNANLFYNKTFLFKELATMFTDYSTKQTIKSVSTFSKVFIKSIENNNIKIEKKFIENFQTLIYTIHYHLSYIFKNKLEKTVRSFIKIIKTKVFCKKLKEEITLIEFIMLNNENYFNKVQEIQLTNFIYKIEEIFQESLYPNDVDQKIVNLIFIQPKKISISMNALLKNNGIDFYQEIWNNANVNEKKTKLLMHLFAYETYFVQGHNHQQIYEDLVLKNIIEDEKYWVLFHQYKIANHITKI